LCQVAKYLPGIPTCKLRKRDKDDALAESKGIRLPGGAEQFVVDFSLKGNRPNERRILGPFPFLAAAMRRAFAAQREKASPPPP
jgi:hypothetical protein